jgi:hypothetical protein
MRDLCVLFIEVPYRHVYSDVEQISLYRSILHCCVAFLNKLQLLYANFLHGTLFYVKI